MTVKISPSILAGDLSSGKEEIQKCIDGGCDYIHLDVMDGHFVPNITFGPKYIKSLRKQFNITFDAHLMIHDPLFYLDAFIDAGCDIITVHYEAFRFHRRAFQIIRNAGRKAGIVINPGTPAEMIRGMLGELDMVVVMTVEPGFAGQKIIQAPLEKITQLVQWRMEQNAAFEIEVDGGITEDNYRIVVDKGADVLVSGSTIFKADNYKKVITVLKQ